MVTRRQSFWKSFAFIQARRKKQRKGKRKLYKRKGKGDEKRRTHNINEVFESQSGHFSRKNFKKQLCEKKCKKLLKKVLTYPEMGGIINKSLTQATTEP